MLESVRSSDFLEHGFLVGFVFYSFLPYLSISSITFGTSTAALDFCRCGRDAHGHGKDPVRGDLLGFDDSPRLSNMAGSPK